MEDRACPFSTAFSTFTLGIGQWLPDKQHAVTQREPNFLNLVTDENQEEFILHIEFQGTDNPTMLRRMQEYRGIILKKYNGLMLRIVFLFWR